MKPEIIYVSNGEIDQAILGILAKNPTGLTNMALGAHLRRFGKRLKPVRTESEHWSACEHANRACQRLRKQNKIHFVSGLRNGWRLIP